MLRRFEQNDTTMINLHVGDVGVYGGFKSSDSCDYSRLLLLVQLSGITSSDKIDSCPQ